jgi:outer membrane protein assembly factor BamD (BamD/ComL family)
MSVSGIFSSSFSDYRTQGTQNNLQKVQQEFQQLGQDLQSGNLSAAQSDFASLQSLEPQGNSNSASQGNGPISQAFNQLSQDLQSGNLSGAQQDYATLQQDVESRVEQGHHHHHHGGGGSEQGAISQAFQELGQALQSGNLSSAQQAYSTLQQDLPQFGQTSGQQTTSSQPSSNSLSVTA